MADYKLLVKLNLSLMVVFSSVVGYLVAPNVNFNLLQVCLLFIGGLCVTGAANACNEVMEQNTDKLMKRTANRPLPSGRMGNVEAVSFAVIALITGLAIMWTQFNLLSAFLSLASFVLYVLAYTPLKKVSAINVFVGAIPGAMPALIGWAAATDGLSIAGWSLFMIQFLWQFPHFWAIAWVAHEDYSKAGLKMLPQSEKDSNYTAIQCLHYTFALLLCSAMPFITGLTSVWAVLVIAIAAFWFLFKAYKFTKNTADLVARQVMFASFIYLPIVYLAFLIFKI
jgi:heme o synthase